MIRTPQRTTTQKLCNLAIDTFIAVASVFAVSIVITGIGSIIFLFS
jgi:hypothetical protein